MKKPSDNTFYFTGDVIVKSFQMSTPVVDDVNWLLLHEANEVVGMHFNGQRWILDRKVLAEDFHSLSTIMEHMDSLPTEHRLCKIIKMHELMNALPKPEDV